MEKKSKMAESKLKASYLSHIGKENINHDGLKMKIVDYKNCNNILVEFEDGTTAKSDTKQFFSGSLRNPNDNRLKRIKNKRIGEKFTSLYNEEYEVIDYVNSKEVIIKFLSTGETKKVYYSYALKGKVLSPSNSRIKEKSKKYIGKTNKAKNGLNMEIYDYKGNRELFVKFEDGYTCKTILASFKHGTVPHPKRPMRYFPYIINSVSVTSVAFLTNEGPQMFVTLSDGKRDIMSWEEIYSLK